MAAQTLVTDLRPMYNEMIWMRVSQLCCELSAGNYSNPKMSCTGCMLHIMFIVNVFDCNVFDNEFDHIGCTLCHNNPSWTLIKSYACGGPSCT